MKQANQQQRGAALVVVLALLTGALVLGVSGMQGALIDERLAGNYRASAQAQMNAEQAAALAIPNIEKGYSEDDAKTNRDRLSISTPEDVKQLRYADVDAKNLKGKKDDTCDDEDANRCFYFPLAIGDADYWAAFGAVVEDSGQNKKIISQSVVLVSFSSGSSSASEIADNFDDYGMLADGDIELDAGDDDDKGGLPFYGNIHRNNRDDDDDDDDDDGDDIEVKLKEESFVTSSRDGYVDVPVFIFSNYIQNASKNPPLGSISKNAPCTVESRRDLYRASEYCGKDIDAKGGVAIRQSAVVFKKDADFEGSLTISDSVLLVGGDFDIEGSLSMTNTTLIVTGDVDIGSDDNPGGLYLENTIVIAGGDLDIDASYRPKFNNVVVMSDGDMDIELENAAQVNGGWFYAGAGLNESDDDGSDLDFDIDDSPDMKFCGGLMAVGDIDFEVDPSIRSFHGAGRGNCEATSLFDELEDDGGEPEFDAWQ